MVFVNGTRIASRSIAKCHQLQKVGRSSGKQLRGYSTKSPPPPPSSSGPGFGPILLSLALIGPSSFLVFKLRGDDEFRAEFKNRFPAAMQYLTPLLGPEETKEKDVPSKSERKDSAVETKPVQEIDWEHIKWELSQLEERAEDAGLLGHAEQFSSEAVEQVKKLVEEADEKAQKEAKAEQEVEKSEKVPDDEATIKTDEVKVPELKKEEGTDASLARRAIGALKRSYNALFSSGSSSTKSKIEELEKKANKDLEEVLAQDLAGLDADGLRRRVVQLTLELKDRNRWEALRMHELTKAHNQEMAEKYEAILREQEEKYEELLQIEIRRAADKAADAISTQADDRLHNVIRDKETAWMQHTQERLEQQKERLRTEMEQRIADTIGEIEKRALSEQQRCVEELEGARAEITALEQLFQQHAENDAASIKLHKVSAALLDLVDKRTSNAPLDEQVSMLQKVGAGDQVIDAALSQFPQRALVAGVPSTDELAKQFLSVKKECQKAAMAPKDSGVMKSVLASVVSKIKLSESGLVEGDDVDACTARAQYYLDHGDLANSVSEIEKLDPAVKEAAAKWLAAARDRLAVDQSVTLLKIHVSSLAKELSAGQ